MGSPRKDKTSSRPTNFKTCPVITTSQIRCQQPRKSSLKWSRCTRNVSIPSPRFTRISTPFLPTKILPLHPSIFNPLQPPFQSPHHTNFSLLPPTPTSPPFPPPPP